MSQQRPTLQDRRSGRVTAERSEISPDARRDESPKAMSIRGAERSEGIAEGATRVPIGRIHSRSLACGTRPQMTEVQMTQLKRKCPFFLGLQPPQSNLHANDEKAGKHMVSQPLVIQNFIGRSECEQLLPQRSQSAQNILTGLTRFTRLR